MMGERWSRLDTEESSLILKPVATLPSRASRRALACALGLLFFAGLLGCARDEPAVSQPFFSPDHVPDVLAESSRIPLHPTFDGNRFVSGWWPRPGKDLVLLAGEEGARIEVVQLAARSRALLLDLVDDEVPAEATVEVAVAGREPISLPVTDPLEIPLAADLAPGRILVELRPRGPIAVRAAAVRPVLPAGSVTLDGEDLVQGGDSRVDVVRRIALGTVLRGRFAPPKSANPEQTFALELERENGTVETLFSWSPGVLSRLRGDRPFRVGLGDEPGLVRLRFVARGAGKAARWTGLRLETSTEPSAEGSTVAVESPDLVVLYVMDALRADTLGELAEPGKGSTVERLAGEGFVFENHRSPAPNTLPSTKALLTGEAWVDRGGWAIPEDGPSTLAEGFRRAGYRTALFSGNVYVGSAYGADRGFDHVEEIEPREEPYNDNAERLHAAALDWLGSVPPDEKVFLYIHTIHPHNPYTPPEPFRRDHTAGISSQIGGDTRTLLAVERRRRPVNASDRERLKGLYAANLAYNDHELGALLGELAERFPGRSPLLAVTSDHGEELFDHGGFLHGYTLYEEMLRIPLLLWSPDRITPGRSRLPTNTLDLHATLKDLATPDPEGASRLGEGRSFLPLIIAGEAFDPADVHLAAAASVRGGIFSIQNDRLKLIFAPRTGPNWGQGGRLGRMRSPFYLFDLLNDPRERHNLAGSSSLEVAWLRSRLKAWIATKSTAEAGDDGPLDEDVRRRLRALGYLD